jgi:uncharacterized protein
MLFRIIPIALIWFLIDRYSFTAFQNASAFLHYPFLEKTILSAFWLTDIVLFFILITELLRMGATKSVKRKVSRTGLVIMVLLVPKLFISVLLLGEDLFRLAGNTYYWLSQHSADPIERSNLFSLLSVTLSFIPFAGMLHGVTKGKYNYKIHRVTLRFKDLPEEFEGYTIAQISDVHAGSFSNPEQVIAGIRKVNSTHPDLIVFTGDLVNSSSSEMEPWIDTFKQLEAKDGKISILGNHDYPGAYSGVKNPEVLRRDFNRLLDIHQEIGFRLLRNEHIQLERNNRHINILGVENWGAPPFPQYGNLAKSAQNISKETVNILLSHDPSHWDLEVRNFTTPIHLTLSGHTHGSQFGVEWGKLKWSPVKYKYPRWAGLYEEAGRYLYVNRGFGYIGFHGRVGIFPEITHITLKKEA